MAPSRLILLAGMLVTVLMAAAPSATAQIQTTGVPGSPGATTTLDGRYLPNPPAPFGGVINLDATTSKPSWPATVVPPKGAPNVLLIMTDDVGFGAPSTFGGADPDADAGPHRERGPALHAVPLDGPVLADARGPDHRTQPPLGRLRRHHGDLDRLSRLQQRHHQGQGDRRRRSSGRTATPPPGSARTTTRRPSRPARSDRSTNGRSAWASTTSTASSVVKPVSGSRALCPQHHADLPLRGQARLEPDHGNGGRRDRLPQRDQRARPGQALLPLLRARWHARAAPPDA